MSNSILFGTPNQAFGNAAPVNERSKIVGRNVARYRDKAGLSQAELAKAIGVRSQNTIAAIETGATEKSKHLHDIARVLRVKMTDLDPNYVEVEAFILPGTTQEGGGPQDFRHYAGVEAGDGAVVLSNEPYRVTQRPQSLAGVRDAYGVLVVGDSMSPVVRAGHTVFINPHKSPRTGDICLFFAESDGEFRATLKEYCGQNAAAWSVKRYQPKERKFTLPKKDWPKCHVVVGVDYSR